MIIDGLITIIYTLLHSLAVLFPQADPATIAEITGKVAGFRTAMAGVAWLFPVDLLFKFLGLIITIEGSVSLFKLIKWIASNLTVGLVKQ
jgi:hypothetical protein